MTEYAQLKSRKWKLPGWLRRIGVAVLWCLAVLAAMVCINALGIFLSEKVWRWQAWMNAHANLLLVWRLLLYAAIVAGWIRIRRQILKREAGSEIRRDALWRLSRVELTCIVVIVLIEASQMVKRAM